MIKIIPDTQMTVYDLDYIDILKDNQRYTMFLSEVVLRNELFNIIKTELGVDAIMKLVNAYCYDCLREEKIQD